MYEFVAAALIAVGVAGVESQRQTSFEDWKTFGSSADYTIEIDIESLKAKYLNGWQVSAKVKLTPSSEFLVKDTKKMGAYYIDEFIVYCKDDYILIRDQAIFSKDGELIGIDTAEQRLKNTHVPGTFTTEYIQTMCVENKSQKVKQRLQV